MADSLPTPSAETFYAQQITVHSSDKKTRKKSRFSSGHPNPLPEYRARGKEGDSSRAESNPKPETTIQNAKLASDFVIQI
jgi:hypothetical protein